MTLTIADCTLIAMLSERLTEAGACSIGCVPIYGANGQPERIGLAFSDFEEEYVVPLTLDRERDWLACAEVVRAPTWQAVRAPHGTLVETEPSPVDGIGGRLLPQARP